MLIKKTSTSIFLWLTRKSDFMDANLVCKLRTLRENLHWYDEGNKTTVERSEEETLWRIFVFQMWVTEIISYNIGLNLVQLKGGQQGVKELIATSSIQGLHGRILTSELEIWIELFFYLKIYLRLYLISDDLPARSAVPTNMEARRDHVPYSSWMTRQDLAHLRYSKISFANWSEKHSSLRNF